MSSLQSKAGSMYYLLTALCALLVAAMAQQNGPPPVVIFSDPALGPSLEEGLRSLRPRMTLQLREGTHTLHSTVFVRDLEDVTIRGERPARSVVVTCEPDVGLVFFNITQLRIRNLTLRGCGFGGVDGWRQVLPTFQDMFILTFDIPTALRVGLLVAASSNVSLLNFNLEMTRGIGLLGVNLMDSTELINVRFEDNVPARNCPADLSILLSQLVNQSGLIGGGAYILYEDFRDPLPTSSVEHSLSIVNSRFTRNRDCSGTAFVEDLIRRSVELADLGYSVGAGGGLSVMMAQYSFAVETSISDSDFFDNVAVTGGGVHVGVFSGIQFETRVTVSNCRFEDNGRSHVVSSGGGMIVNIDLIRPLQLMDEFQVEYTSGSILIEVEESRFVRNRASNGGGVAVISQYYEQYVFNRTLYRANFHDCRFGRNQALGGSAMLVYENKISGFNPGLQVGISDCTFRRNSIQTSDRFEAGFVNDYGVVHVRNVNVTLSGMNVFDRNRATALGSLSSIINMAGTTVFERNKAVKGAGMQLVSESILVLLNGAKLSFRGNRADLFGGAIFVQMNPENFTFIPNDCFLYFNRPGYGLCSDSSFCLPQNVSLTFDYNRARLGSLVYGSTLVTCSWVATLERESPDFNPKETVYENLRRYRRSVDYQTDGGRGGPLFSTITERLRVEKDLNISVMPGEQFFVNVTAMDHFGNPIPEVVTSSVVVEEGDKTDDDTLSVIGDFGYFEVRPQMEVPAPITIFGEQNREVTLRLTAIDLESDVFITVILTPCGVGFTHVESQCVCDSRLESHGVSCSNTDFIVGADDWLGPVYDRTNTTNNDLTVARCVLNYCGDGRREIPSGEWHLQCRESFHRAGRLCGTCEEGYSLQLGTNACDRCTNWSIFLLVFFILAGVFVEFVLGGLLQISVAEGFFTAILFYSNIITLYSVYFNDNEIEGVNFLTAFFTLNFGIPACLYDGLNSLVLIALQLAFVAYLFLLAALHIVFGNRKLLKFVDSLNQKYSPSKTFATLIILTYVSILQSSFGILGFSVISSFDGDRHILWFIDPTVDYFSGFHVFLCLVAAVLLIVFILPPPILFTFGTKAIYRWRYFNKLKPLYDAMFAPFKAKFRPWLGLQFIFRIVLFFNAFFVPSPHHLLVVAILLTVYLLLQSTLQPYKLKWANHFESTLIVNALVYVIVTLYFESLSSVSEQSRLLTVIFLSLLATCLIVFGFLRYAVERNPKAWGTFKRAFQFKKKKTERANGVELNSTMKVPTITFMDTVGNNVGDTTLQHSARSASVDYLNSLSDHDRARITSDFEVSYTDYREPLLDEGELEMSDSYSVIISRNTGSGAGSPSRSRSPVSPLPLVRAQTTDQLGPPVDSLHTA